MKYTSQGQVDTPKAVRYLKALCNHFERKVTASYTDNHGQVQFSIGNCEMDADDQGMRFSAEADTAENLEGVKGVISSHLERFTGEDALKIQWVDQPVMSEDQA
jgi:hypothetical protein